MTRARLAVSLALAALAAAGARADDGLALSGQLDWLSSARGLVPTETPLNFENRVLRLPQLRLSSEVRPSLVLEWGGFLTLVARPRLQGSFELPQVGGQWPEATTELATSIPELFGSWRASDWLALSWGLQNFQWGPGELSSPSNRLFHESGLLRDPLYLVQGKHLVRVNLSSGKELSAVALVELSEVEAQPFVAREDFAPSAHVKLEYAEASGSWLVGVTGFGAVEQVPGFGEYAQVQVNDTLALYLDASHVHEPVAWVPGESAFTRVEADDDLGLFTTALLGARLSFESGAEARVEVLYNQAGWDEDDFEDAAALVLRTGDLEPWLAPGFELIGQRFVFVSMRMPELPPMKKVTVMPRVLVSATDGSAAAFVTVSAEAGDSTTAFLSAFGTLGDPHDELSRLARAAVTFGVINTW